MDVREKLWRIVKEAIHSWESDVNMSDHITDNLIAHGVTVQEWISVKDRLPEPFEDVLAYDGTQKKIEYACVTPHKEWYGVAMSHAVTHWMHLPQPPKGE